MWGGRGSGRAGRHRLGRSLALPTPDSVNRTLYKTAPRVRSARPQRPARTSGSSWLGVRTRHGSVRLRRQHRDERLRRPVAPRRATQRQPQDERTALPHRALDQDVAAVLAQDLAADRQAQAGARAPPSC